MSEEFELIKKDDRTVCYRVNSVRDACGGLIAKLPWPDSIPRALLVFKEKISENFDAIAPEIPKAYSARWVCYALRDELAGPEAISGSAGVSARPGRDISEIRSLYLQSVRKTLAEEWGDKMPARRLEFSERVARDYLDVGKSLCLLRGRDIVGIATYVSLDDFLKGPVDCFNWAWLDSSLSLPERISAQSHILGWLKGTAGECLNCYIDLFNKRSQKFAKRLGFRPKCLLLERS